MPRTFDITPLRSLVAVATTGGVRRAAQSLLISQSAVSQHLRKLEREAGVPLVYSSGRGIAFTPEGERMLGFARTILSTHDRAVNFFDNDSDSVVIGSAQNSAALVLPMLSAPLRAAFEPMDVRIFLDRNRTVRELLEIGEIDLAVTTRVAPELRPREDGFRLRWLWGANGPDPEAGAEVPLVVFTPPCTLRQPSFDSWSLTGRRWRVAAEVEDLAGGLDVVRTGGGAMLAPMLEQIPDGLRELSCAPDVPAVQLVLVRTAGTSPELVEIARSILADHVGEDRVETQDHAALAMP